MRNGSALNTTLFSVDQTGLVTVQAPLLSHKEEQVFELNIVLQNQDVNNQADDVVSQLDVIVLKEEVQSVDTKYIITEEVTIRPEETTEDFVGPVKSELTSETQKNESNEQE